MKGRLNQTIFAIGACALALALAAPPAVAAGGCGGPADSALNQYCESIPNPRGSQAPQAGMPALATSLPGATVRRIQQAGRANNQAARSNQAGQSVRAVRARALLTLPAPDHLRPARQAAIAGGSTLPLWLILLLVATGLALATAAAARWRRSHGTKD